jgi:hypothetical protein
MCVSNLGPNHVTSNALTLIFLRRPALLLGACISAVDVLLLRGALARGLLRRLVIFTLLGLLGSCLLARSSLLGRRGRRRAIGVGHNELSFDLCPRVAGGARVGHAREAGELLIVDLQCVSEEVRG